MNITIIIPTYNEGENIGNLLDALFAVLKKIAHHNWTVLIVDGKSTDNTATVIDYKMKTNPAIRFISEKEKKGLGNAYLRGINYAIEELAADAFMEFDGDFQHDPADIIKLIDALDKGYQYIIGSRYVPGGTIPREWAWYRRFLSSFGNLIIKYGLWISTKDNTSGFKLTKVKGFEHILPLREGELLSLRHAYKFTFYSR
jgi:dolichol-phosphate mannosyltransferase